MGFIRGICSSYTHILWSWLIFLLVDILDIWHKRNLWHFYHDYRCCYRFYSMDMDNFFSDNGGHSDYEHEDMDHDMPIHVKIDN